MIRNWMGTLLFLFVCLLSACGLVWYFSDPQTEVYTNLTQEEANQMVSLLTTNQLDAKKVSDTTSAKFKVTVPRSSFVYAVESLRQGGYPRKQYASIDDLFPTNQLVSSPGQETAKFSYLKEQRLEQLLSCLEGVVEVHVIISEPTAKQGVRESLPPSSASVLIKHSTEVNLDSFVTQIKSLAKTSVAGLEYDNISVVLQATDYRGPVSPVSN